MKRKAQGVAMRFLFPILFFSLMTAEASAVNLRIRGEKGETLWQGIAPSVLPSSLGAISLETFAKNSIPYAGDEQTVSEIFGLGTKVEAVSEDEMKVYGWCYSLDGEMPATTMDQVPVRKETSEIVWFYAYALAYKGSWVGQCFTDEN